MTRIGALIAVLAIGSPAEGQPAAAQEPPRRQPLVFHIRLDDHAITPITARYIERVIQQAEREGADAVLITLDTPGGLVDSTRLIVKTILASRVPVIVYVAPSGARAASAGVFITLSAHAAAMAPGTNIGAAHPAQIGGLPGSAPSDKGEKNGDVMTEKIVNDTVAWARSLAELRGRDPEWAAKTVRESLSVPADEAARVGAVDLVAETEDELLQRIHGREVRLPDGMTRLNTAGAEMRRVDMWWGERLLGMIANPNIAVLLLLIGFYGILFELYSPGWGVGGTLGVICLILGFVALAVLPVNYAGLALLLVALALFVAEVFVTSYGTLAAAGVVCLILGGTMLVDSPIGFQRVSLSMLIPVALATAVVTFLLVGSVVRAQRRKVQTGSEWLAGREAVATEDFAPQGAVFAGLVRVHGELWKAVSPAPVRAGDTLAIETRHGLILNVHRA